jgi:hypothetical protein
MIALELDADPSLIRETELPPQMTLIKQPTLDRQRELLHVEPWIGLEEGVRRVCAQQRRLLAMEPCAEATSLSTASAAAAML